MTVRNLNAGYVITNSIQDLKEWEEFYAAERIAEHVDALENKLYIYEKTEYGIYQITDF